MSKYSFPDHKKTNEIQVLDLDSGNAKILYKDSSYSEPTWISEFEFVLIKGGEKGTSSLVLADVNSPGATSVSYSKVLFPLALLNSFADLDPLVSVLRRSASSAGASQT